MKCEATIAKKTNEHVNTSREHFVRLQHDISTAVQKAPTGRKRKYDVEAQFVLLSTNALLLFLGFSAQPSQGIVSSVKYLWSCESASLSFLQPMFVRAGDLCITVYEDPRVVHVLGLQGTSEMMVFGASTMGGVYQ